ncbi:class I SAM-dependent methyltransferase [Nostoc sp. CHAB 5844]|nr:class I SAM-dependent methyltransferase [Nostoc sp. CHAB 5844]
MLNILKSVRLNQKNIEEVIAAFLFKNFFNENVRKTGHFRQWLQIPMNYARIMEIPLTMLLLDAKKEERILDISSPKLLALYYSLSGYTSVVAADMEDYFINDFEIFKKYSGLNIELKVFDTTKLIPYPENYFDKIFSISVLEHIPYDGDTEALKQILRVLKPSGTAVITLPAFSNYIEEWISSKSFYWKSVTNANGAVFYQRRYDLESIHSRLSVNGGKIDKILFVAERPIKQPGLNPEGRMLHNSYYIDHVIFSKYLKKFQKFQIPLSAYFAENYVSHKCHYITDDHSDVNIRQAVIKIKKDW